MGPQPVLRWMGGATAAVSSVTICRDGGQGATVTRWQWCHSPMVCGPLRWMRATASVEVHESHSLC